MVDRGNEVNVSLSMKQLSEKVKGEENELRLRRWVLREED